MKPRTKTLITTAFIITTTLLVGCANKANTDATMWFKEGVSQADISKDLADCRLKAGMSNAGFHGNSAAQYMFSKSMNENSIINDCMQSKGYTLKPSK